ncbi:MAG: hypothetical protein ACTSWX_00695 [Promethearchaeota archaeon]
MTTKIIDNTIVSLDFESNSLNLMKILNEFYSIETTNSVYNETINGFDPNLTRIYYSNIKINNLSSNIRYVKLYQYFQNRYPYLHDGEVSAFLLSLINFHLKDKPYYFISDDNKMRKVCLTQLNKDKLFLKIINKPEFIPNFVGTIGIIKHLFKRNFINKAEMKKIIFGIRKSSFRITNDLINILEDLL